MILGVGNGEYYRLGVAGGWVLGYDCPMVAENQVVEKKIRAANRSELAREIGVTRTHVSLILSGKNAPSLPVAAGMAKRIGVSLDQFWDYLQTASVN